MEYPDYIRGIYEYFDENGKKFKKSFNELSPVQFSRILTDNILKKELLNGRIHYHYTFCCAC